jgi:hypothetical protein
MSDIEFSAKTIEQTPIAMLMSPATSWWIMLKRFGPNAMRLGAWRCPIWQKGLRRGLPVEDINVNYRQLK